jgi:hypothetical protein
LGSVASASGLSPGDQLVPLGLIFRSAFLD